MIPVHQRNCRKIQIYIYENKNKFKKGKLHKYFLNLQVTAAWSSNSLHSKQLSPTSTRLI